MRFRIADRRTTTDGDLVVLPVNSDEPLVRINPHQLSAEVLGAAAKILGEPASDRVYRFVAGSFAEDSPPADVADEVEESSGDGDNPESEEDEPARKKIVKRRKRL